MALEIRKHCPLCAAQHNHDNNHNSLWSDGVFVGWVHEMRAPNGGRSTYQIGMDNDLWGVYVDQESAMAGLIRHVIETGSVLAP